MRTLLLIWAVLLSLTSSAKAQSLADFDVATAAEAANLLQDASGFETEIRGSIQRIKDGDIISLLPLGVPRTAAAKAVSQFGEKLAQRAAATEAFRTLLGVKGEIDAFRQRLQSVREKLESAQQQIQLAAEEVATLRAALEPYLVLSSEKGRLDFVKGQLAAAVGSPKEIDLGNGDVLTIQVSGAGKGVLTATSELTLNVQYLGGLSVTAKKVEITATAPFIKLSPNDIEFNTSTIGAAAQSALGEVIKQIDFPLPVKIENVTVGPINGGFPTLLLDVSVKIPGFEDVLQLLESQANKSIRGRFRVTAKRAKGQKLSSLIVPDGKFEMDLTSGTVSVPLGSGLQYVAKTVLFTHRDSTGVINEVGLAGSIVPMPAPGTNQGLEFEITVKAKLAGAPRLVISGKVLVQGHAVGDFECIATSEEVSGTVTFPEKEFEASLGKIYRGNFAFKLNSDALTANGALVLYSVLKSNFDLHLSLNGGPSSLTTRDRLSLGLINAEANLRGELSAGYRDLTIGATLWCEVDLLVYKPTARVEIHAAMKNLPSKVASTLATFDELDVKASALGVTVSFSPSTKSFEDIKLSDIEEKLRKQLGNMFDRLASAAADWEKDKRDMLAGWERHWAETISSQAKKYGLDRISTGNPAVDKLLGEAAKGVKGVGSWFSDIGKGFGAGWTSYREKGGNFLKKGSDAITSRFRVAALQSVDGAQFVTLQQDPLTAEKVIFEIYNRWGQMAYGARRLTPADLARSPFKNLEAVTSDIRLRFPLQADRDAIGEALREGLEVPAGGTSAADPDLKSFGAKLEKALSKEEYDSVTDAEALAFSLTAQSSQTGLLQFAPDPSAAPAGSIELFMEQLGRTDVLREHSQGTTVRQLHLSFDDIAKDVSPQQVVTIGGILRVAGSYRVGLTTKSAGNLVPFTILLTPVANRGDNFNVAIDIPDLGVITDQQFQWMKDNHGTVGAQGATFDGFDASVLQGGDDNSQKLALSAFLRTVFAGDVDPAKQDAPLDPNSIAKLAVQTVLERTLVDQINIIGPRFQFERRIAVKNLTADSLEVNVNSRSRRVNGQGYSWVWSPSAPDSRKGLEFIVPAGPGSLFELTNDDGTHEDDAGAGMRAVTGSRIRLFAKSRSGEVWDFSQSDTFLVEPNPLLGGERAYQATSPEVFIFTIQSKLAPAVQLVTIFQSDRAIVEHRGDAMTVFDLPVRFSSADEVLSTLSVETVKRSVVTGNVESVQEENWNATIPSEMLHENGSQTDFGSSKVGKITVSLVPGTDPSSFIAGQLAPSREVVLRYQQQAPSWKAGYRLTLSDRTDQSKMVGWFLFENQTGLDWKSASVDLRGRSPNGTSSSVGVIDNVALERHHGRLNLQQTVPLEAKIDPFLVFNPERDCCHPTQVVRIALPDTAQRGLPAGIIRVTDDSGAAGSVQFDGVAPGGAEIANFPGKPDDDICIERNDRPPLCEYRGECLRSGCFEYAVSRRTIYFNANYGTKYSSRSTGIRFELPAESCWRATSYETAVKAVDPIQELAVVQVATHFNAASIDLFNAPVSQIEAIRLERNDPYGELLKSVISARVARDKKALDRLLCCPDLIITDVTPVCDPVKEGMIPEFRVKVRNLGGAMAVFRAGEVVVNGAEVGSHLAGPGPLCIGPCCTVTIRVRGKSRIVNADAVDVSVDPDNRVNESFEKNNDFHKVLN